MNRLDSNNFSGYTFTGLDILVVILSSPFLETVNQLRSLTKRKGEKRITTHK